MSQDAARVRDLLFALQGLQTGLIEKDDFLAAIQQWKPENRSALREILLTQTALSADACGVIDSVVAHHVEKHGDFDRSLEKVAARVAADVGDALSTFWPTPAAGGSTETTPGKGVPGDSRVSESQSYEGGTVWLTPAEVPGDVLRFAPPDGTDAPARFMVLRPHAKGGLGAVHVALDRELNREVALKQIQERHADDRASRARFVFEAEVTGALEHPGIVPVYSLGADVNGRPYYAMRFIRGDTFSHAIVAYHAPEARVADSGARALQLRKLLRRFIDVCNAIDYAHSRGVLHRDIKPANIIVGQHGESLVVDWGLAKAVGRFDPAAADGERVILPSSGSGSAETIEGSALGTPSFMSPEQASGYLDRLGPASDVYSLGATLYCLLTGRPPFVSENVMEVLKKAQDGDFPPPRRLERAIPLTLEAIVLKAMARGPKERYNTARALADDIERWMADEPTSARRERFDERARRWMRRRRTSVTAAVAALLASLLGLAAVVLVQSHANAALQSANSQLAASNQRERERFTLALEAIKTFHTGVSRDVLLKEKAFGGLRKKLLAGAADFYGKLGTVLKNHDDRNSRSALGDVYRELAGVTRDIGTQNRALELYRQALELRRTLAADREATSRERLNLVEAILDVGRLHQRIGDFASACAAFDEALDLVKRDRNETGSKRARAILGRCYWNKGSVELDLSHTEAAIAADREASAIQRKLVDDYPGDVPLMVDLANTDLSMGYNLLAHANKPTAALIAFQHAREIQEQVVAAEPEDAEYLRILSECHSLSGVVYLETGRAPQAVAAFESVQAILRKLVDTNPNVTQFQDFLASELQNAGIAYAKTGDRAKSLEAYTASRKLLEKLVASDPSAVALKRALAGTLNNIGDAELSLGRVSEAREAYTEARSLLEPLIKAQPGSPQHQQGLAFSLSGQGRACLQQGQYPAGAADLRAAITIWNRLTLSTNESLYALAGNHALIAGLAQVPGSGISATEAETEAKRAVNCLRKPLQAGYHTVGELRADPDFRALLRRSDFENMLLDLQFPQDPFARR